MKSFLFILNRKQIDVKMKHLQIKIKSETIWFGAFSKTVNTKVSNGSLWNIGRTNISILRKVPAHKPSKKITHLHPSIDSFFLRCVFSTGQSANTRGHHNLEVRLILGFLVLFPTNPDYTKSDKICCKCLRWSVRKEEKKLYCMDTFKAVQGCS